MASNRTPEVSAERAAFYGSLAPHHLAPLWEVMADLVTPTPSTPAVAARWRFADVRPFLLRAGELITAKEAERRVLILENPALPGQSAITHTLYAGLQLILPGEVAPAHRHSQAALRFIMEGDGAHTIVDGRRAEMHVGDLILTPSWVWHSHGNDTSEPMIWLDGLDVPLVSALDASFSERERVSGPPTGAVRSEQSRIAQADSAAMHGNTLRPLRRALAASPVASPPASPFFVYPHSQWREALQLMRRTQELDTHDGWRIEFTNPLDGSAVMPTMSAFCQLVPKGHATRGVRATDGTVYVVTEGSGTATIDEQLRHLVRGDIFVVPSWSARAFTATNDLVLFSFSDRAAQQKLGLWREQLL